jgi:hypothetical protein
MTQSVEAQTSGRERTPPPGGTPGAPDPVGDVTNTPYIPGAPGAPGSVNFDLTQPMTGWAAQFPNAGEAAQHWVENPSWFLPSMFPGLALGSPGMTSMQGVLDLFNPSQMMWLGGNGQVIDPNSGINMLNDLVTGIGNRGEWFNGQQLMNNLTGGNIAQLIADAGIPAEEQGNFIGGLLRQVAGLTMDPISAQLMMGGYNQQLLGYGNQQMTTPADQNTQQLLSYLDPFFAQWGY